MYVLIITALYDEIRLFLKQFAFQKVIFPNTKIKMFVHNKVLVLICNIGLTNASTMLSFVQAHYHLRRIINIGCAGTTNLRLPLFSVVFVTKWFYLHAHNTMWNYKPGQIPGEPHFFQTLMAKPEWQQQVRCPVLGGVGFSSNTYIDNVAKIPKVWTLSPETVTAFDMEGAAIAQVATLFSKPCYTIKIISDYIAEQSKNNIRDYNHSISRQVPEQIAKVLVVVLGWGNKNNKKH